MKYNIRGICEIYHEEEGWGWISIEGQDDAWVHFSSIQMDGFQSLTKGEGVLLTSEFKRTITPSCKCEEAFK